MARLTPIQIADRSVLGSIGEGLVLALFRASGYKAYHVNELRIGNPDVKVEPDDHGNRHYFEVKYKIEEPPWQKDFRYRKHYQKKKADIIWINLIQRPYIRIGLFPWKFENRVLVTEPIMESKYVDSCFCLDRKVYEYCEYLIDKHLVFPWMEYHVPPPSQ